MGLTILNVAYPLAAVGPRAVGGAEQMLTLLDRALVEAGHTSLVIACEGSQTAGELFPSAAPPAVLDASARTRAARQHRELINAVLRLLPVDVVHLHGIDCYDYLPDVPVPTLVTLHLPSSWYPANLFATSRPRTFLHCVSETQKRQCPSTEMLLPTIPNGVPLGDFRFEPFKDDYCLALGRICPEKGWHLALEAARMARARLVLCGAVYPYPDHEEYHRREVLPRLDRLRRFFGPVTGKLKRRLLAKATCLLVPSLAPETSSLVAMEALASGTPVVAFPSGALPEIVVDGKTGFLVNSAEEMALAINRCKTLSPARCREAAESRFSFSATSQKYFALYRELAEGDPAILRQEARYECRNSAWDNDTIRHIGRASGATP